MTIPEDLLYTKEHEWVKILANTAKIGITDYAQSSLGDITFIQLPRPGIELKKSGVLATVESVKAASDVYSPLHGIITSTNSDIISNPELVNSSPYDKAWFVIMEIKDYPGEGQLLKPLDYKKYLDTL